jgi:hypothetical protein
MSTKTFSGKQIDRCTLGLKELPKKLKEEFTLLEAVHEMYWDIDAAIKKNYSFADIANFLTELGFQIQPSTLRKYMREVGKNEPSKRKKRSPKKPISTLETTSRAEKKTTDSTGTQRQRRKSSHASQTKEKAKQAS